MGHLPGTPCVYENTNHTGPCTTFLPAGFVDLSATRWFAVNERLGHISYWRTNRTAAHRAQVELLHGDGDWHPSLLFDTEEQFLRSVQRYTWREIDPKEVGDADPDPEAA